MDQDLARKAISAALDGNWKEAISINSELLKINSEDLASLNRLTRAYTELGKIKKAKITAKKALKIDPFNKIADKALKKLEELKEGETVLSSPSSAKLFIEEPGKTKIVPLIHLGSSNIISKLDAGDEVKLEHYRHRVQISTQKGDYVGKLADDVSSRLKKLIKLGNEYQALVKTAEIKEVKILIRETKRGKKAENLISFPEEKNKQTPFVLPRL